MQPATRKWRAVVAVLLAGVVLRAFVPAGYMPAAPVGELLWGAERTLGVGAVISF